MQELSSLSKPLAKHLSVSPHLSISNFPGPPCMQEDASLTRLLSSVDGLGTQHLEFHRQANEGQRQARTEPETQAV